MLHIWVVIMGFDVITVVIASTKIAALAQLTPGLRANVAHNLAKLYKVS